MAKQSAELAEYKSQGIAASVAMQAAARAVHAENRHLRALLDLHGVSEKQIESYLVEKLEQPTTAAASASGAYATNAARSEAATKYDQADSHRPLASARKAVPRGMLHCNPTSRRLSSAACPKKAGGCEASESKPPIITPIHHHHATPDKRSSQRDGDGQGQLPVDLSRDMPANQCSALPDITAQPVSAGNEGTETSCDAAAAILVQLQSHPDPTQARAALGCVGLTSCFAKNTKIFRLMDELG